MDAAGYFETVVVLYVCALSLPLLFIYITKHRNSSGRLFQSSRDNTADTNQNNYNTAVMETQTSETQPAPVPVPVPLTRYFVHLFLFNLAVSVVCCWALLDDLRENNHVNFANSIFYYTNANCHPYEVGMNTTAACLSSSLHRHVTSSTHCFVFCGYEPPPLPHCNLVIAIIMCTVCSSLIFVNLFSYLDC